MGMKLENAGTSVTALLDGEIDHHVAGGIREEIDAAIDRLRPKTLILDFKGVTFMDSSGIGLVMGRYQAMQALGGRIVVRNASRHIRKVMRLASLDRLAEIE